MATLLLSGIKMKVLTIMLLLLCSIGAKAQKFTKGDTVIQMRSAKHTTVFLGRIHKPWFVILVLDSICPNSKQILWYAHDDRGLFYDRVSEITIRKKTNLLTK